MHTKAHMYAHLALVAARARGEDDTDDDGDDEHDDNDVKHDDDAITSPNYFIYCFL